MLANIAEDYLPDSKLDPVFSWAQNSALTAAA